MKVAIVHYWLVGMRGGEKVLDALCDIYPEADIYTHVVDEDAISANIKKHKIYTTFINSLPGSKRHYQKYLPLMPMALESLDLTSYDLVISSESGPAKGVIVSPGSTHICYVHSPMRYIWDKYYFYKKSLGFLGRFLFGIIGHYLRIWDVSSSHRVDLYISNSGHVANRVKKYYRRDSVVLSPPVSDEFSESISEIKSKGYYLWVGELVSYKRPDLAIDAFNKNGKSLFVVGGGEEYDHLKSVAGENINFLGKVSNEELKRVISECEALIFPGEEDFGIVPVEAMMAGKPVIAYGKGGVLDSVVDGLTGVFFDEETPGALLEAVEKYEATKDSFDKIKISEHARKFSVENFKNRIKDIIDEEIGV